ncbi:DNA circularization N-terminal domain-containing protein [Luteibacter aegosomatis]|uniref:DNA circularization protein n=1 Tax=Luteibacter aegosomatis TaxID=2911537 RepID=UPI001FF93A82|nr:DNA circularization N-terminal domain-containing protein [Luteibacter aegosomatis]UPG87033.1 DNA circularization N-terminal domain-containing protein [Luteibacter aegosomatis]
MSWKDNLLPASFRSIAIDVVGTELDVSRSLALHGVPYRDGESVEDLGRDARRFEVQVVCWGDNYETTLQELIVALDSSDDAAFVHPVYGNITVHVERYRIRDDAETPDRAEISLTLIESGDDPQFFQRTFVTTADAVASTQQLSGLASAIASGKAVLGQVRSYASAVRGVLAQVVGIVSTVRNATDGGWTGLMENVIGQPGITLQFAQLRSQILGTLSGLAALADGVTPTFDPVVGEGSKRVLPEARDDIEFTMPTSATRLLAGDALPQTVPGQDNLPAMAVRAWQVALVCARQGVMPTLYAGALDTNSGANGGAASGTAIELPDGLPADAVNAVGLTLVAYLITEQAMILADAVCSVFDAELDSPSLSPNDVDALTAQVRSLLQSAIIMHRELFDVEAALTVIEPLRQLAQVVQVSANAVINIKPPIVQRVVPSMQCLRRLAFLWYGDNTRANELLRLNPNLVTPYSISAGQVLNAYAN